MEENLKIENYLLKENNEVLRVSLHKAQEEIKVCNKKLDYFLSAPKNKQTFNDLSYSIQVNDKLSATQVELLAFMFQEKEDCIDRLKYNIRRLEGRKNSNKNKKHRNKLEESLCKTYLIKNNRNGFYKIGKSKNPLNREKTLQAEEHLIKIVKLWSEDIESKLHKEYHQHRVRGEWFKLSKIQVKYICTKY